MHDRTARTLAWLEDLAAMVAEIDTVGWPGPARPTRKRGRKPRPLWEE